MRWQWGSFLAPARHLQSKRRIPQVWLAPDKLHVFDHGYGDQRVAGLQERMVTTSFTLPTLAKMCNLAKSVTVE